jgi:RMKL-like, methyltransferase domain
MRKIAAQISPEARSAYFKDYLQVAEQELQLVTGGKEIAYRQAGPLEFFELECEESYIPRLLRLSFVQGLYSIEGNGEEVALIPIDKLADFRLHDDFVFGSKYRGKTNERLTQMLINVGLSAIANDSGTDPAKAVKLLDPMCGRATTLLWAMRYGIAARGIEQDVKAIADIRQSLKKWSKLHRQKHKMTDGFIGKPHKNGSGKFLDFSAEETSMRVVVGDARQADQIFKKDKFDLLVSDLPYGVQHFTTDKTRNPLAVIDESVQAWKHCLKKKGAIVLAFNSYIPKRRALIETFEQGGFEALPFSASHRMSESIVRDVVIFRVAG